MAIPIALIYEIAKSSDILIIAKYAKYIPIQTMFVYPELHEK